MSISSSSLTPPIATPPSSSLSSNATPIDQDPEMTAVEIPADEKKSEEHLTAPSAFSIVITPPSPPREHKKVEDVKSFSPILLHPHRDNKRIQAVHHTARLQEKDDKFNVSQGLTHLGFQILGDLFRYEKNPCISPFGFLSIIMSLFKGSSESWQERYIHVLKLSHLPKERIPAAIRCVLLEAGNHPLLPYTFLLSNAVIACGNLQSEFRKNFEAANGTCFPPDDIQNKVNKWVGKKTEGLIREIHIGDCFNNDSLIALISALYFNGAWKTSFNESETYLADFTFKNGLVEKIVMMNQEMPVRYFKRENLSFIEVPYQIDHGQSLSQIFIMPEGKDTCDTLLKHISIEVLLYARNNAQERLVDIHIPRMDVSFEIEASSLLTQLGLPLDAPYSHILSNRIACLNVLKQKIRLINDETGAETPSSTFNSTSSLPVFKANRPFIYLVVKENIPLFMGAINDKTALLTKKDLLTKTKCIIS